MPEVWSMDEVSTRNCYHCLAPREGVYVRCRRGHELVVEHARHKHQITYNGVVKIDRLLKVCRDCQDFDNNWNTAHDGQ